ncbi:MAG: hypothetical protein AABX19_02845 [Nanoarchaeota archaeon]
MLLKVLALADFIAVFSLVLVNYLPHNLVIIMGIYLILKGLFFTLIGGNFISMLDFACGIYHVLAVFGFSYWLITTIVAVYVLQKSFVSFMS